MATLSKTLIESIAKKMTEKSYKFKTEKELEFRQLVTDYYEKQIPQKVIDLFKTHSEYVETTMSVYLDNRGFNRHSVALTKRLPSDTNYNKNFILTAPIADKLIKAKGVSDNAKAEYKILLSETESALLALKTEKNVRENLPEAIPFLPPPMSNSLVVNFKSLQNRLNKQPETKENANISKV